MNRKGLITVSVLSTVGKIVAAVAFATLLSRCSQATPEEWRLSDEESARLQLSEFDYSLGKSATQHDTATRPAPQSYNYGRTRN